MHAAVITAIHCETHVGLHGSSLQAHRLKSVFKEMLEACHATDGGLLQAKELLTPSRMNLHLCDGGAWGTQTRAVLTADSVRACTGGHYRVACLAGSPASPRQHRPPAAAWLEQDLQSQRNRAVEASSGCGARTETDEHHLRGQRGHRCCRAHRRMRFSAGALEHGRQWDGCAPWPPHYKES